MDMTTNAVNKVCRLVMIGQLLELVQEKVWYVQAELACWEDEDWQEALDDVNSYYDELHDFYRMAGWMVMQIIEGDTVECATPYECGKWVFLKKEVKEVIKRMVFSGLGFWNNKKVFEKLILK